MAKGRSPEKFFLVNLTKFASVCITLLLRSGNCMSQYKGVELNRNSEIRTMYDAQVRMHVRRGLSYKEAKENAYDAVCLIFSLSWERARKIINENVQCDERNLLTGFIIQNQERIDSLNATNVLIRERIKILQAALTKNEEAVKTLQTSNDEYKQW